MQLLLHWTLSAAAHALYHVSVCTTCVLACPLCLSSAHGLNVLHLYLQLLLILSAATDALHIA